MTNGEALNYFKGKEAKFSILKQIGNGVLTWEKLKDFVEGKQFNKWLDTFIDEKKLPYKLFTIEHNSKVHFIDNNLIVELIKKLPLSEKRSIKNILVRVDLYNGDVNHFLEHLATGYVRTNF